MGYIANKVGMDTEQRRKWFTFFGMLLVSVFLALIVVYFIYHSRMNEFVERADHLAESEIKLQETLLIREMHFVSGDIRYLTQYPLMLQYLDHSTVDELAGLQTALAKFASERNVYDQIRLLSPEGQELIRIECANHQSVEIPLAELRDKSSRYYVKQAMNLRRGQIYVSPLDLNMEDNVVERPFKPTIRFAMGVYDSNLQKRGTLILNYNASSFLKILRESSDAESVQFMFVDSNGYWLSHPDSSYEWGQFISKRSDINFAKTYADVWPQISTLESGKIRRGYRSYTFNTVNLQDMSEFTVIPVLEDPKATELEIPAQSPVIKHIAMLSDEKINAMSSVLFHQNMLIVLVWFLMSIIPTWGLSMLIVNRKLLHDKLARQAYYDHLTGLANRELFNDRFDQALKMAERHKRVCALLYIDLDGFKQVNDTMGHHIGDELLCSSAIRMLQCVRKSDTVARMGGDEFAVLLTELQDKSQAMLVGEKIISRLFDPFQTSKGQVNIGASLGVAIYPDDATERDRMLELADKYMYSTKRQHKQNIALTKEAG